MPLAYSIVYGQKEKTKTLLQFIKKGEFFDHNYSMIDYISKRKKSQELHKKVPFLSVV